MPISATRPYGSQLNFVPFCFWECGKIGVNVEYDGLLHSMFDLTPEQAEKLAYGLLSACAQYNQLEELCKQHDGGYCAGV